MDGLRWLAVVTAVLTALPAAADFSPPADTEPSAQSPPAPSSETPVVRAERLAKAGRVAEAIPILNGVLAYDRGNPEAWTALGFCHRKLGLRREALEDYRKALEIDPDHRGAIEYLGELFLDDGDLAQAEQQLAQLVRLCPNGCGERTDLSQAIAAARKKPKR